MPRMSHSSSRELSRSLQTKTHCLSFIVPLPKLRLSVYGSAMRTVWTMGFVAAAALSFCFPDFIVFRFTQAVIWAIALLGPGAAVRRQRPVLLRPGRPVRHRRLQRGHHRHPHAALGLLGPARSRCWWATPRATGLGRIAGGHSLWTQALVTYAFAIAFPQLLRWRLIEQWTGGVQGLYLDFPTPPGGILAPTAGVSAWRSSCWRPACGWPAT